MSSSGSEKPTTSTIATTGTTTATVVKAVPITVQAAAQNSPAFINLSVGELQQQQQKPPQQRHYAVLAVPSDHPPGRLDRMDFIDLRGDSKGYASVPRNCLAKPRAFPLSPFARRDEPPQSKSVPPVGTMNRFPIMPISRRSLTPGTKLNDELRHAPPIVVASSISMRKPLNNALAGLVKSGGVAAVPAQFGTAQKPIVLEEVKTEAAHEQPLHGAAPTPPPVSILGSSQLDDLVQQIDPTSILEEPVKNMLTEVVDDFVDQVIERSCKLASHRGSVILEPKDVEFVLRRYFNCPTIAKPDPEALTKAAENAKNVQKSTEMTAHNQRMAMIKKALKKP